jgi:hypothetical protein
MVELSFNDETVASSLAQTHGAVLQHLNRLRKLECSVSRNDWVDINDLQHVKLVPTVCLQLCILGLRTDQCDRKMMMAYSSFWTRGIRQRLVANLMEGMMYRTVNNLAQR